MLKLQECHHWVGTHSKLALLLQDDDAFTPLGAAIRGQDGANAQAQAQQA